jgi:hypothetical protein
MSGKCSQEDIFNYVEKNRNALVSTTLKTLAESTIGQENVALINQIIPLLLTQEEQDAEKRAKAADTWRSKYYKNSGRENFDNLKVMNSIRDAISSRHATFFDKNDQAFKDDCAANITNTFTKFKNAEMGDINKLKNYMKSYLTSYQSIFQYASSLGAIKASKVKEIESIQNKIETYNQNLHIDERKNGYNKRNRDFYDHIHFYILILYYSLFVLYLIFSNFFKEQQYKNKLIVVLLLLFALTPIILPHLLVAIYNSYIFVMEYYNLREDVISYPHIIGE